MKKWLHNVLPVLIIIEISLSLAAQTTPLSVEQVEKLIKLNAPDTTISQEISQRGLSFIPDIGRLENYRQMGAGPLTLKSIERFMPVLLDERSPAYQIAKKIGTKIPSISPHEGTILIESKHFKISSNDVIQELVDNIGGRAYTLQSMDASQVRNIIQATATNLGERRLVLQAASESNVYVAPDEFNSRLMIEYKRGGGESKYLQTLNAQGISIDRAKQKLQETMLIEKYYDKLNKSRASISEEDLRKAYIEEIPSEQTATVRHILLLTQGKTETEKAKIRSNIGSLLAKVRSGEDFSALAKKYSEDPASKNNGGLYENIVRGQMVKPFEDAAFSIPIGEISEIVETTYGYHIIKVEDRKKEAISFEQYKIRRTQKKQEDGASIIKDLKEKYGFTIYPLRLGP